MRLVLRLHPDDYTALRDEDRKWIEGLGYEIWSDPSRKTGCAIIMDIGHMTENIERRYRGYYEATLQKVCKHGWYNFCNTSQTAVD